MKKFLLYGGILFLLFYFFREKTNTPISKPLILDRSCQTINGNYAVQVLGKNENRPMIIVGDFHNVDPHYPVYNIILENFILDGNKENQDSELYNNVENGIRNSGIVLRNARNCIIRNCTIRNCRSAGICLEKGCRNVLIEKCILENNEFDGIAGYDSTQCIISHCIIRNNKYAGLSFDWFFNKNQITDNIIYGNDLGVFLRHSHHNIFKNNSLNNESYDFYFHQHENSPDTLPYGNILEKNKADRNFINQKIPE